MIPFGEGKLFSDPFPTGVAGKESEAWTAESIFSQSRVGELGADFRVTSCCLSLTASSCRRSEGGEKENKKTKKPKNPILVIDSLTNTLPVHLQGAAGDNSPKSWVSAHCWCFLQQRGHPQSSPIPIPSRTGGSTQPSLPAPGTDFPQDFSPFAV